MTRKECFRYSESPYHDGKCVIVCNLDNIPFERTSGSLNILPARLLNLSYANYLRMCRDLFDAEIVGKNTLYPIPYFKKNKLLFQLVKLLNARANLILFEREKEKI